MDLPQFRDEVVDFPDFADPTLSLRIFANRCAANR
jgi:hypothetical protein